MQGYSLALGILAVWRVTHLLNAEDGPGDILVRIRRLAGSGFWGSLLDCFYCLSLWTAIPFAILLSKQWLERVLLWLAFSAGAILLERVTLRVSWPQYTEEPESHSELLREEARSPDHSTDTGG